MSKMRRFGGGFRQATKSRALRLEPLENRNLLSAAGVVGTVIHDADGNFYSVDIRGGMAVEWLGTLDDTSVDLLDIAFSPGGDKLYGVGGLPASLYQIDLDLANPTADIPVHFIHEIRVSPGEDLLLNALEFGPDGNLYAAGWSEWTGESFVYQVDPGTGGAAEVIATDGFVSVGGYSSAGDLTFAEDGSMYLTTMYPLSGEPHLLRINPEMTGVEAVGPLFYGGSYYGDLFGLMYGPGPEMYAFGQEREVFFVNRADAAMTFIADLGAASPELDGHFVQGAATLYHPPVDLGEIDFASLTDQEPVVGELWYTFDPVRDGYLSAVVVGASPTGNVDLTLYTLNADGTLQQRDWGTGRLDYEWAAAGQQYFLQIEGLDAASHVLIANLLQIHFNDAVVHGTSGNDVFTFSRGTYYDFSINGVAYQFGFSGNVDLTFNGGPGADTATLAGQATRAESVVLDLGAQTGEVTGFGYKLHVTSAQNMSFQGGSGDTAMLIGTALDDAATLRPASAELTRPAMAIQVTGVNAITAETRGGNDTLTIQGSNDPAAKDQLRAYPGRADYSPASGVTHHVTEFETLEAYANAGTSDTVFMYDSNGIDHFYADPTTATLSGPGFELNAHGFTNALGYSSNAGRDTAELVGSPDDDEFLFYKGMAKLYSPTPGGFFLRAKNFEVVTADANAGAGSADVAFLLDSKLNDRFTGERDEATMEWNVDVPADQRTVATATNFRYVHGYSRYGGTDTANLHDSPGDDGVHAKPDQTTIYEQMGTVFSYVVRAKGFREVNVHADAGGYDTATMNDSTGADLFSGSSGFSEMTNPAATYRNRLYSFEKVVAISRGNAGDNATLYDTAFKDDLVAEFPKADPMHYAQISSSLGLPSDFICYIRGFDHADAWSSNPEDVATIDPLALDWLVTHGW